MGVLSRTATCSGEMCGWEGMGVFVGVYMEPSAGLAASRLASWSMPSWSAGQQMVRCLVARAVLDMTCSKLSMDGRGGDALSRATTCSGGLSGVSDVHPLKRRYYPKHNEMGGWEGAGVLVGYTWSPVRPFKILQFRPGRRYPVFF